MGKATAQLHYSTGPVNWYLENFYFLHFEAVTKFKATIHFFFFSIHFLLIFSFNYLLLFLSLPPKSHL